VKAIVRTTKEMQREAAREEREEGNPAPLFDDKFGQRPSDPADQKPSSLDPDAPPPPPSTDADR
jgi:hypothetical protein